MTQRKSPSALNPRRWFALLTVCVGVLAFAGCNQQAAAPSTTNTATDEPEILRCEVLKIEPISWPAIVRTQGSLFADEVAVVGAKVAGRVAEVHVDLGDRVRAGMPLVTLETAEFQLAVDQASAQLEQARAAVGLKPGDPLDQLKPENAPPVREVQAVWDEARTKSERWQQLAKQNAVTESDLQAVIAAEQVAEAQYASALNSVREKIALIHVRAAELALAQQHFADTVVPAPFDGLVRDREVAPGSFVQVGSAICAVVRTDPLHFRGMMPERHARRLALGQPVSLQIESIDEPRTARVTRISPTLDPLSRSLLFEAEIGNEDHRLQTGLFAEAAVTIDDTTQALAVPDSAIIEFAGVEKVWKLTDGTAGEQVVVTGARRDGLVEIIHGLAAGDRILRHGREGRVAQVEEIAAPIAVTAESAPGDVQPAESAPVQVDVSVSEPAGSEGSGEESATEEASLAEPDQTATDGAGGP